MIRIALISLLFVLASNMLASLVSANQMHFSQEVIGDGRLFSYKWVDKEGEVHSLQFQFSNQVIKRMPSTGAAYRPQLSQLAVKAELLKYAKTIDPRQAKIDIKQQGPQINISVSSTIRGEAEKISKELNDVQKNAQAQYLKSNFYLPFKNHYGQSAIKHDHARYALLSIDGAKIIAKAIEQSIEQPNNLREFVNLALSWIQSIPYNTLEDRISSNGSGFAAPKDLIISNRGDCDSKSTLMAALIKAYAPSAQIHMIFLPKHALLGVKLKPSKKDKSIKIGKHDFVLFEPTGPAFYTLGEIAPSSHNAIRNRQYTTEAID